MTLRGQLGLQYLDIGEIDGTLDQGAHDRPILEIGLKSSLIASLSADHNI
jgi:hypothetical protein